MFDDVGAGVCVIAGGAGFVVGAPPCISSSCAGVNFEKSNVLGFAIMEVIS